MLAIPPRLLRSYETFLDGSSVPAGHKPHYIRWLRFYLDFCQKYHHDPKRADSLGPFCEKLQSKRQEHWKRQQASQAVDLYHRMLVGLVEVSEDAEGYEKGVSGRTSTERQGQNGPVISRGDSLGRGKVESRISGGMPAPVPVGYDAQCTRQPIPSKPGDPGPQSCNENTPMIAVLWRNPHHQRSIVFLASHRKARRPILRDQRQSSQPRSRETPSGRPCPTAGDRYERPRSGRK
jgi:hypothetical protein